MNLQRFIVPLLFGDRWEYYNAYGRTLLEAIASTEAHIAATVHDASYASIRRTDLIPIP